MKSARRHMGSQAGEIGAQKTVHGTFRGICEECGTVLDGCGRGPGKRFCSDGCRMRFHSMARAVGQKVLRRKKAGSRQGAAGRRQRANLNAGLLAGTHLARSVRVSAPRSTEERRMLFARTVQALAGKLSMGPAAERRRLESVAPERVNLRVPVDDYQSARRNAARLGVAG